jgi:hypothetical protein
MKPITISENRKIRTIYQETSSARGVETNVGETSMKSSLKFEMDLFPEKRPEIFTHSFVNDPDNFVYFKLIQKRRRNKVDTDHCSRLLMESALNSD